MSLTCERCLSGRHPCLTQDCACQCRRRSTPKPKAEKKVARPKKKRVPRKSDIRRRKYSAETLAEAATLRSQGKSWQAIGEAVGAPAEGIRYALNNYGPAIEPNGNVDIDPGLLDDLITVTAELLARAEELTQQIRWVQDQVKNAWASK